MSPTERVDDDVLKASFDVVLQSHDRSHPLRLTLIPSHDAASILGYGALLVVGLTKDENKKTSK